MTENKKLDKMTLLELEIFKVKMGAGAWAAAMAVEIFDKDQEEGFKALAKLSHLLDEPMTKGVASYMKDCRKGKKPRLPFSFA